MSSVTIQFRRHAHHVSGVGLWRWVWGSWTVPTVRELRNASKAPRPFVTWPLPFAVDAASISSTFAAPPRLGTVQRGADNPHPMAFFGLTQIGAQSPFVAESRAALDLTYFSDEELEAAFLRVVPADRGSANVEQIGDILNVLYHGEPPEHEVDGLRERLDRGDASGFTLRDFVAAAAELRGACEGACHWVVTRQLLIFDCIAPLHPRLAVCRCRGARRAAGRVPVPQHDAVAAAATQALAGGAWAQGILP